MRTSPRVRTLCFLLTITLYCTTIKAQTPDPNLHIYLCYGQSNMSGQGVLIDGDDTVSDRFKVLRAAEHSGQTVGNLYPGLSPLGHSASKLGPADFFGRKMVEQLPSDITVAVANIAIGGQSIDLFDKASKDDYIANARTNSEWWLPYLDQYGGDVYNRIIEIGNKAKEIGVIKGILFHQGEADWDRDDWPVKVKKVYDDIISDLNLDSNETPILIGELLSTDQGGDLGSRNGDVAEAANGIPNGHVVSSAGCAGLVEADYTLHFNRDGYKLLGERYAAKMLNLLGYDNGSNEIWLEAECGEVGDLWSVLDDTTASDNTYVTIQEGNVSAANAPDITGQIQYNFSIEVSGLYTLWARIIAPTADDDSFWVKVNDGSWLDWNNITPSNVWVWDDVSAYQLEAGSNTITIGYREDGANLDKLYLTDSFNAPSDTGNDASNCGVASVKDQLINHMISVYPNPVNTVLSVNLPEYPEKTAYLNIFTIDGSLVKRINLNEKLTEVPVSDLKTGMYYINGLVNDTVINQKFIVN